jgi:hypothetical protein
MILRQSTAVDVLIGPFLDLTDGATAESGETPTVKLSKNGQALAAKSDVTVPLHDADGYYNCELDATDTGTVGTLVLTVAKSATALPVRHEFQVMDTAAFDALYADGALGYVANAPVSVAQWNGSNVATPSVAGVPEVDVTHFNGTAGAFAAGRPEVNTTHAAGTAWGSGAITAASIAASALDGKGNWNIGKTGYALSASQTFDLAGNITGNLSGSVGSVTGAVGSVTGNVGGNVTGSVGSVVGAVGSVTGAVGSVTGLTASDVGAIKAKTDNLPAAPAATGDIPTATQNADALLNRDMSAVAVTNARSPINALRWLRNKWSNSGGTLTVYAEDDTTTAWTATTTTAASDPVDSVDPA